MAEQYQQIIQQMQDQIQMQAEQMRKFQEDAAADRQRLMQENDQRLLQVAAQAAAAAIATANPSGSHRSTDNRGMTLIDTKGIGKPPQYDSNPRRWISWAFKLENFVAGVYKARGRESMEWAAAQDAPILDVKNDSGDINESLY